MSSQGGHEIAFSISTQQAPFRLLELPPELLNLLTSDSPPSLQLKSTDSDTGSSEAALCTPNKTYQLRQVQTSNSLFITTSSERPNDTSDDIPIPSINAITQLSWSLELSSVPASTSALTLLRQALPIYQGTDIDVPSVTRGKTKLQVFDDIPLSNGQLEEAWLELCAFETAVSSSAYRPSATLMHKAWTDIMLLATETSTNLSSKLRAPDLEQLVDLASETPPALAEAVLRSLVSSDQQKLLEDVSFTTLNPKIAIQLNRAKLVRWAGCILLTALVEAPKDAFIEQWKQLLPELWRDDAQLIAIDGTYVLSGGKVKSMAQDQPNVSTSASVAATPKATAAKRKWHEKFKEARKR